MSEALYINVQQIPESVSDPEDVGVAGSYVAFLDESTSEMPLSKRASIALDVFHRNWGIACLDDFKIDVVDHVYAVIPQDPEHENDSCSSLGVVNKLSDEPMSLQGQHIAEPPRRFKP